jgi:2-keto-4-pentenoate hydratase
MDEAAIDQAAACFLEARRTGVLIDALPASCRPADAAEAHAIQDRTAAALDDEVVGWKVGAPSGGVVVRGGILSSRLLRSPASAPLRLAPKFGIEPEIAFRLERDLPARDHDYGRDEIEDAVTALLAIEILDSRFAGFPDVPEFHLYADFVSNGGLVLGPDVAGWRDADLINLPVRVTVGGEVVADVIGGHPRQDPLIPVIELVNQFRTEGGVGAGRVMTTGSYCGLRTGRAEVPIIAAFGDLGTVELRFQPD